jgi:hypothetical protein
MSSTAKDEILEALDDLPEQSLAEVVDLIRRLRAKAVAGPFVAPPDREAAPASTTGFAEAYAAWRGTVAADDLDVSTAYFDRLRDTSIAPDVKL